MGAQGGSGGWREGCWGAPVASVVLDCRPALQLTAPPGLGGTGGSRTALLSPVCHQQDGGSSSSRDRPPLAGGDGTTGAAEIPCSARFIWRVLLVCSERPKAEELSGGQ